jgi:hypothetical protein
MALAVAVFASPALVPGTTGKADAAIFAGISVTVAPPALMTYEQPPMPAPGYIWTPGYWAWNGVSYYWVDGAWVEPPEIGYLWTPAWWDFVDGAYIFHAGYWGDHVGWYGGIDYGCGYGGRGYDGGYWDHGHFRYNQAVNNFGRVHVTNFYNRPVHEAAFDRRGVAVAHDPEHAGFRGQPVNHPGGNRPPAAYDNRPVGEAHHPQPLSHWAVAHPAAHAAPASFHPAVSHAPAADHPVRQAQPARFQPAHYQAPRPVQHAQPARVQQARFQPARHAQPAARTPARGNDGHGRVR